MNHPQATIEDILGHRILPCYFSKEGNNPFKYHPCRNCTKDYMSRCADYISSQQDKTLTDNGKSNVSREYSASGKTADTYKKEKKEYE